jgi:hypothetical protein
MVSLAYRQLAAQTEDPQTMAMSASEEAVAQTIAIPPFSERIILAVSDNIASGGNTSTTAQLIPNGKTAISRPARYQTTPIPCPRLIWGLVNTPNWSGALQRQMSPKLGIFTNFESQITGLFWIITS